VQADFSLLITRQPQFPDNDLASVIPAVLRRIARVPCTQGTNPASCGPLVLFASRAARAPSRRESLPGQDQPPMHMSYGPRRVLEAAWQLPGAPSRCRIPEIRGDAGLTPLLTMFSWARVSYDIPGIPLCQSEMTDRKLN
jgi:hypothetical protein